MKRISLAIIGCGGFARWHAKRIVEHVPELKCAALVDIIPDNDGQKYTRDFKLIDQSDMIISLIPELEDGRPGLSSGVERELQLA